MQIKILKYLPRYRVGDIVRVPDDGGNPPKPLDIYWYRRLQDAAKDSCCAIVKEQKEEVAVVTEAPKRKTKK